MQLATSAWGGARVYFSILFLACPENDRANESSQSSLSLHPIPPGSRSSVKKVLSDVVDLNDDNFDKIVMDSANNVLVEFYAPCKQVRQGFLHL